MGRLDPWVQTIAWYCRSDSQLCESPRACTVCKHGDPVKVVGTEMTLPCLPSPLQDLLTKLVTTSLPLDQRAAVRGAYV